MFGRNTGSGIGNTGGYLVVFVQHNDGYRTCIRKFYSIGEIRKDLHQTLAVQMYMQPKVPLQNEGKPLLIPQTKMLQRLPYMGLGYLPFRKLTIAYWIQF